MIRRRRGPAPWVDIDTRDATPQPNQFDALAQRLGDLDVRMSSLSEAIGRIEARQLLGVQGGIHDHEFRVYSHAGEDGIIQFLVRNISISRRYFVEFGVEDYRESNTRFLMIHDHWAGLVMDSSDEHMASLRASAVFANNNLQAVTAFVTRENVNAVLEENGVKDRIGLLSIDVDGNDYWIFDAIEVVQPDIAVVEYNHRLGPTRATTIPYSPDFQRSPEDSSWLMSGASLSALCRAASRKNMSFVGCNSYGNNAFFVRSELVPDWMPRPSVDEGFREGLFRERIHVNNEWVLPSDEQVQSWLTTAGLVDLG